MPTGIFGASFVLEECHHNGAGSEVRSDHAAHRCVVDLLQIVLPDVAAVLDVLQEKRVRESAVVKQHRLAEINVAHLVIS